MSKPRPIYVKPAEESLYPSRNREGQIETLINPTTDTALSIDNDSKTNFTYNRYHHLPMSAQRQKLPVFQYRNHILYLLEKHQTLVLVGETGCGKSTQVPQYLNEIGHKVCVTQPRVTAAVTLARRVADEIGQHVGQHVGYAAGMTAERTADTGVVFMTEGVLLREMFASPLLMQYSCIVLDEVHERTLMTDVLMGLLKKICKKRPDLKLVISSATMDAEFLKDFFNISKDKTSSSVIMSMQGRTHPIDVFYSEEPVPDYVKATVETITKIHENEPFGDVLAFLTSQEEILEALDQLQSYAATNRETNKHRQYFPSGIKCADMNVLPMYGSLPHYSQIKVFQMADKNVRKVVLATNIAETSVTIPGIVYVIDCGFHKLPYFDPGVGIDCITATPISKNNATQRAGRAGRTQRGKCYRLYTEAGYEALPATVPPEMCRSDLSTVLLRLKALGIHNVLRFTFPTPPPAKCLLSGLETLYALEAIDRSGLLTEEFGIKMSELPLKPTLAKILCNSGEYGCIEEALSIVSMLQVDNVFAGKASGKETVAARISRRNNFEVAEGDIIMYLNILDSYIKLKQECGDDERRCKKASQAWCRKLYLNYNVMEKACEIRKSLEKIITKTYGMENKVYHGVDLGSGKCTRVMKCVLSGLFSSAASLHYSGAYRGVRQAELHIAPTSCLYRVQQPKWVVFANIQTSSDKNYMRDLMVIQKEWLLEVAPHYYREI